MYVWTVYGNTTHKYESLFQKMMLFKEIFPPVVDVLGVISYNFSLLIDIGIKQFKIGNYGDVLGILSTENPINNKMSTFEIKFEFLSYNYNHHPTNEILHNPKSHIVVDREIKFGIIVGYNTYSSNNARLLYEFVREVNNNELKKITLTLMVDDLVGRVVYEGEFFNDLEKIKAGFNVNDYADLKIEDMLNGYAKKYNLGTHFTGLPILVFQVI